MTIPGSQLLKIGKLLRLEHIYSDLFEDGLPVSSVFEMQAKDVFIHLKRVLRHRCLTQANVFSATCRLADTLEHFATFNGLYLKTFRAGNNILPRRAAFAVPGSRLPFGALLDLRVDLVPDSSLIQVPFGFGQKPKTPYSPVVLVGGKNYYFSGVVCELGADNKPRETSPVGQFSNILDQLEGLLGKCGLAFGHVTKFTVLTNGLVKFNLLSQRFSDEIGNFISMGKFKMREVSALPFSAAVEVIIEANKKVKGI